MRVRDTYFKDYGLSESEVHNIESYCRRAEGYDQDLILQAAREVYPEIAKHIFYNLTTGTGYNKMRDIPINRNDFQGYRRKTIETYFRYMKLRGKDISRG